MSQPKFGLNLCDTKTTDTGKLGRTLILQCEALNLLFFQSSGEKLFFPLRYLPSSLHSLRSLLLLSLLLFFKIWTIPATINHQAFWTLSSHPSVRLYRCRCHRFPTCHSPLDEVDVSKIFSNNQSSEYMDALNYSYSSITLVDPRAPYQDFLIYYLFSLTRWLINLDLGPSVHSR